MHSFRLYSVHFLFQGRYQTSSIEKLGVFQPKATIILRFSFRLKKQASQTSFRLRCRKACERILYPMNKSHSTFQRKVGVLSNEQCEKNIYGINNILQCMSTAKLSYLTFPRFYIYGYISIPVHL